MCGRTTRINPDLFPEFSILGPAPLPPGILTQSTNVTPGQDQFTILMEQGTPKARMLKWGLVPSSVKDPKGKPAPFNARAETAASKPYFRDAFRIGRCLVLVDGFYEWQKRPSPAGKGFIKQPFFIHLKSGKPFALAGLYAGNTVTILTTTPNALMAPIHDRMPCILNETDARTWLAESTNVSTLHALLHPCPPSEMECWPVGDLTDPLKIDCDVTQRHTTAYIHNMDLFSVLTCPACGHAKRLAMPTDACVYFHECAGCHVRLKPKPGDCCVFCSYGSVPCPPMQTGNADCCTPSGERD